MTSSGTERTDTGERSPAEGWTAEGDTPGFTAEPEGVLPVQDDSGGGTDREEQPAAHLTEPEPDAGGAGEASPTPIRAGPEQVPSRVGTEAAAWPAAVLAFPPTKPPRRRRRLRPEGAGDHRVAGYAVLGLVVAACLALSAAAVVKARDAAVVATRESAGYRYSPPPAPAGAGSLVTVIGDTATFGAGAGADAGSEWPTLVAATLKVKVVTLAAPGSGYVARSTSGSSTFVTQAAQVSPTSRVVVFFGGGSDQSAPSLALATAVTKAFATAASRAPNADIVVVGPMSSTPRPPASLLAVRDTLRGAAAATNVHWVDPIAQKWLVGGAGLVGSGGHPTKEGQLVLERDFRSLLDDYL